jgi:hypothetical protein
MTPSKFKIFPTTMPIDGQKVYFVQGGNPLVTCAGTFDLTSRTITVDGFPTAVPWYNIQQWRPNLDA